MSDFEKQINASDLIEWIIETDPDWCVGSVRSIIDHIDKMPSAQPIRCKDCRWRDDYGHWFGCPVLNTDDDNFCSMAERKTDGSD